MAPCSKIRHGIAMPFVSRAQLLDGMGYFQPMLRMISPSMRCVLFLMCAVFIACGSSEAEEEEVETVEVEEPNEGEEDGDDEVADDDEELDEGSFDHDHDHGEDDSHADEPGVLSVHAAELLIDEETTNRVAPETRALAHILLRFRGVERGEGVTRSRDQAETLAEQALARIQEEEFAVVASEMSDDISNKEHGGELGALPQGLLPEPLDDALFSMEIGEVRGPIESPLGFHIVKRTE